MFDLAKIINNYLGGQSITELMNMSIEEFMDLAVYCINSAREEKEDNNSANNNVKTITRPATTSIKNGGWY